MSTHIVPDEFSLNLAQAYIDGKISKDQAFAMMDMEKDRLRDVRWHRRSTYAARFICAVIIILIAFFASCGVPKLAHAQRIQVKQPPPNCNVMESRYDNPFSDSKGFYQPAIAWHAEYMVVGGALAYGIHKTTGLSGRWSAGIASIAFGLVPHIRGGLVRRDYAVVPLDWLFDWTNRSPGLFFVFEENKKVAAFKYVATYATLACFSSP